MTVVSAFAFLVCAVIVASCFRREADVLSPVRIFAFIWALGIGLAELKLSKYQQVWSTESWIIVLLGPASLLAGLFAVHMLDVRSSVTPLSEIRALWRNQPLRESRLFVAVQALFILFIIGYGGILLTGRQIPAFAPKPGIARIAFQLFGIGLFLHNVLPMVFLTAVYSLRVPGARRRKLSLVLVTAVAAILYGLTLQRFQIVMSFILCAVLLYYATNHLRPRVLAVYLAAVVVFFLSISTVRGGNLFMYYLYIQSQMTFSPHFAILTEPYMYFVMGIENLARATRHLENFTYGFYTFDFAWAITGLKHWLQEYFRIDDTPFLVSGYNTYTMFWDFYRDFGVIGVTAIPCMFGITIGHIYRSLRRAPTLSWLSAYAVSAFILLFSFFLNFVSMLWFVYDVVLLVIIIRWVRLPESWPALQPASAL